MTDIFRIAVRNLLRYRRRSLMTALLIVIGLVLVIVFSGISGSFKNMMIGMLTDSMLGHLQIHKKGYVSSIDNLPLHLNIGEKGIGELQALLDSEKGVVEAYTFRIKLGAMLSNFEQTTNIRLTAVVPEMELRTCPMLVDRLIDNASRKDDFLKPGQVLIPENLATGLKLKAGDEVVLVATNQDGSVNGLGLKVAGVMEGLLGPSGRDGYMHIEDARNLLRIDGNEINEIAIRLRNPGSLDAAQIAMARKVKALVNPKGMPTYELHTWADLSPFSSIAMIVDVLVITVKIVLISIVLVSVLNVMMMAVYERVREIGTIAAIGTLPSRILGLFLAEGFMLGLISTVIGVLVGVGGLLIINLSGFHFSFGRMKQIPLKVSIAPEEVLVAALIVVAVALFSSFQPAYKASRLAPVEALRRGGE